MRPVLVLQHEHDITAGHLGDVLAEAGVSVVTVPLHAGAPVPEELAWSAVVTLGGRMGAYDDARYPFLAAEKEFLRRAVAAEVPVLGICLGCQLLADALGGRAYRVESPEAGRIELELTPEGIADRVVSVMTRPVFTWHEDTWESPPGSTLLARSARFPHAFRTGSALGIQAHPEVTAQMVAGWVDGSGRARLDRHGIDPEALIADLVDAGDDLAADGRALFTAWLRSLDVPVP